MLFIIIELYSKCIACHICMNVKYSVIVTVSALFFCFVLIKYFLLPLSNFLSDVMYTTDNCLQSLELFCALCFSF